MDLGTFIERGRPRWRQLEAVLRRVEGSGLASLDEEQAVLFGRLYRRAASDLNQAQTFVSGDAIVQYLNNLVARCYLVIYAKTKADPWGVVRHLIWGFPAVFRRYLGYFVLAVFFFAAGTGVGFVASYWDPDVSRGYLLPSDFPMIQPSKEGEPDTTPAMSTDELQEFSGFLFRHNVSVTLAVFALGMTFGVGTAWLLFDTGLITGALGAVFLEAHQFRSFCTGILPHGVLEIPACLIGGAAGFLLARAMIRARPWPRLEELTRLGKEALLLVSGCLPLLAMAAFLEAVVARAPDAYLSSGLKLAVAGVMAVVFAVYTLLLGWGGRHAPAGEVDAAP